MRVIHAFRSLPLLIGTALVVRLGQTVNSRDRERGDVPGWVMITLMSATLVAIILVLAQNALSDLFNAAMDKVSG